MSELPSHLAVADSLCAATADALPQEVLEALKAISLGGVKSAKRIKVSFHETLLVEFSACRPKKVIVQILGAQIIDKPIFKVECMVSKELIVKAIELASSAGVKVPQVLATGQVAQRGKLHDLDFVVYEFIATETVEDKVRAPNASWRAIVESCCAKFASMSLANVDTDPLPRFDSIYENFSYLKSLAGEASSPDVLLALQRLETEFRHTHGVEATDPVLIHQDLNGGNVLCSRAWLGAHARELEDAWEWKLDALIDFEGAAVGDPRMVLGHQHHWKTLRRLARVVAFRWLAWRQASNPSTMPRCQLEELAEDHAKLCRQLSSSGYLAALAMVPVQAVKATAKAEGCRVQEDRKKKDTGRRAKESDSGTSGSGSGKSSGSGSGSTCSSGSSRSSDERE